MDSNTVHWIDFLALHSIVYDRCWLCWCLAMERLLFYICDMWYWDWNLQLTIRPLCPYHTLVRSNCDTTTLCSVEFQHPILSCIDALARFAGGWIQVNRSFAVLHILQETIGYCNWIYVNRSVVTIDQRHLIHVENAPVLDMLVNRHPNDRWNGAFLCLNSPIWWGCYSLRLHLWFRPISSPPMWLRFWYCWDHLERFHSIFCPSNLDWNYNSISLNVDFNVNENQFSLQIQTTTTNAATVFRFNWIFMQFHATVAANDQYTMSQGIPYGDRHYSKMLSCLSL